MVEETYKEKYYRVSANIDLDALCSNILNTRKRVCAQTKIMAVIKADGYGHGAVPIAHAFDKLEENGIPTVASYGVAAVEEAVELRRAGITKPILLLGYTAPKMVPTAVKYDLTQTIFQLSMAKTISAEAIRQKRTAKIHIKLDTGMGRLGYAGTKEDVLEVLQIAKLPNIYVEGLFSHFAMADAADKTSAKTQLAKFLAFAQILAESGLKLPVKHISNSAGIIDLPEANLDMVRSGISTYGLYPSEEVSKENMQLIPALELKSSISFVKQVQPGFTIGYGSTFAADRSMRIATIPVGYADGYPRSLSNCGRVLIHGKTARIVGRICMDQFMADVTDIPEARQGDTVTLVGRDGKEYIPVEEPAKLSGSFNYEFVCGISKRVPRIYYKNGIPILVRTEFPDLASGII